MTFLSEAHLAALVDAGLPALGGGFDGRIQSVVTGGPDGDVKILATFEAGHLTGATLAAAKDAELTLTVRHADVAGVLDGTTDLNVLFMTGRMKTAGPTGPLLDLVVAVGSDEGRAALAAVAAAFPVDG